MKRSTLMFAMILFTLLIAACSENESSTPDPDAGITQDVEGIEDVEGVDNDADADTGEEARECTLELELDDGLVLAETWEDPVDAGSEPLICWTVPESGELPEAADGWEIRVEREENAGGPIDGLEWYVTGLASEALQIAYGDCMEETDQCTDAADLSEGTYFLHIIDPGRNDGLAASLVFEVQ